MAHKKTIIITCALLTLYQYYIFKYHGEHNQILKYIFFNLCKTVHQVYFGIKANNIKINDITVFKEHTHTHTVL